MSAAAIPDEQKPFWSRSATQWDIAKWILPILAGVVMTVFTWGMNVQATLARHELLLQQQSQLIRDHEQIFKKYDTFFDERGQRLSRIEAKVDVVLARAATKD